MSDKFKSALFGAITLGADPEIFLTTPKGKPWGARDCSTGTKAKPEPFHGGGLQVDGLALEYNIPPAETIDQWVEYHSNILDRMEERAKEQGLVICDASFLDFAEYIKVAKATEDELEFGCEPDLNAMTGEENVMPDNDGNITYRTTGGHVHVGFSNWPQDKVEAMATARSLVKVMDATLGLWSVLNDNGHERKKLYGNAGAFRLKSYGFEYRTLSNFWVFQEIHMNFVYTTVTKIMSMPFEELKELVDFAESKYEDIASAINNNDLVLAKELYDFIKERYVNA